MRRTTFSTGETVKDKMAAKIEVRYFSLGILVREELSFPIRTVSYSHRRLRVIIVITVVQICIAVECVYRFVSLRWGRIIRL